MTLPRIYADLQNADPQGRVRLNTNVAVIDLATNYVTLREGLHFALYADDADEYGTPGELCIDGVVHYSKEEHCWVATIEWAAISHVNTGTSLNGIATKGNTSPSGTRAFG